MLNVIIRPLQAPAIWLLLSWTLLGRFAVMAVDIFIEYQPLAVALAVGFMAPVWYLIIGALCIFAHKHLLHVARGVDDEPLEQITDLNPFQDSLALQCCLLLLIPLALIGSLGADLTLTQVIVPALIFPLLWMGVMLEGSLSEGLHPANLWRIVVGLNVFYPLAAAIISACVGLLLYTTLYWHDIFVFAGVGYLFLLGHGLAGKILYWRRGRCFCALSAVRSSFTQPKRLRGMSRWISSWVNCISCATRAGSRRPTNCSMRTSTATMRRWIRSSMSGSWSFSTSASRCVMRPTISSGCFRPTGERRPGHC
ncbi:MAG: hypothetical protein VB949_15120 [Pseudomonadales bacterium]